MVNFKFQWGSERSLRLTGVDRHQRSGEKTYTVESATLFLIFHTEILCTGAKLIGAKLEGSGSITSGFKFYYTGCIFNLESEVSKTCEARSSGAEPKLILSNTLKGLIVLVGGEAEPLLRIEPTAGETFMTIVTGPECPVGESIPIKGKLYFKDCSGLFKTHAVGHLWEAASATEMTALGKPSSQKGSIILTLVGAHSGLKWSGDPA